MNRNRQPAHSDAATDQSRRARKRILLTNDDGYDAAGLSVLVDVLGEDHDVIVAAPSTDWSGSGTGIGRFDPHVGVELIGDLRGTTPVHSVDGPPGLAVMSAALGAFGAAPDLVVSGVNAGMNTGHSVIHSGTVGAVLTARTFGISGVALSLQASDPWQWDSAAQVAREVVGWIVERLDTLTSLNVNVPGRPINEIGPARWVPLDEFGYFRVATAVPADQRLQFEVAGLDAGATPGCDTAMCRAGHVTLTSLMSVEMVPPPPGVDAEEIWAGLREPDPRTSARPKRRRR